MAKEFITAGTRKNAWTIDPSLLVVIGIDTKDGADHPLYDARAFEPLDDAMVANIAMLGVLEPVLIDKDEDERVVVVDGRRRVLHAREANRRLKAQGEPTIEVPVFADSVRRGGRAADRGRWGLVMVSANEIRKEDSVLNKASKAKALLDRGVSKDKVADAFGVGVAQVEKWMVLASAPAELRAKVESGEIAAMAAVSIAMKAPAQQKRAMRVATDAAAKNGGKRASRRELEEATGKTVPPTRKHLRDAVKRADELVEQNAGSLYLTGVRDALRFAYEGGPFLIAEKAEKKAEGLTETALDIITNTVLGHGLTDRSTPLMGVVKRLEVAGYHLAPQDVSKACLSLCRDGVIAKSPKGYRLVAEGVPS